MKIKGGRNRNVDVEIYEKERDGEYLKVIYTYREVMMRCCGAEEKANPTHIRDGLPALYFYDRDGKLKRRFHLNGKGGVYITIGEEDYDAIKGMIDTAKQDREREKAKIRESIPLTFVVENRNLRLLDMYYTARVFVPQKGTNEMTLEERERYRRLIEAVKKCEKEKYHLDGYIDADDYDEGMIFTLDDMEATFKDVLEDYDALMEEKRRKKEEKEREIARMREGALKKARETGKIVYIRVVGGYDGDERYPGSEYGWVNVWEVATPEGKITTKDVPSY